MGREARVHAEAGADAGEANALLEGEELILRGAVRRRFPRAALEGVVVDGEVLRFSCAGETVSLRFPGKLAATWAAAVSAPPPSLRAKLSLDKGAKAFLVGSCDDAALTEALAGALADDVSQADMIVARIDEAADLTIALTIRGEARGLPVWAVYRKGGGAAFGEQAIRAALRREGLRDTKVCAVSKQLAATRYTDAAMGSGPPGLSARRRSV